MYSEFRFIDGDKIPSISVICVVNYYFSDHGKRLMDAGRSSCTIGLDLQPWGLSGLSYFGMNLPTWEERAK